LFRLFPEVALSGLYGDNIPLRATNEEGDFAGTMAAGFFLDYTSAARNASLHYDTFAQLFAHNSQYDRAGEGQYVSATDAENLSATTNLRIDDIFYRDSPGGVVNLIASTQALPYNTVAYQLLLANDRASINWFNVALSHNWGRNWSSELSVHQETFWPTGNNSANNPSYYQAIDTVTNYNFPDRFSLGLGDQFSYSIFTQPGQPAEQLHYPYVRAGWLPIENLYLSARVGVVISHSQGTSGQQVNPGGGGLLEYTLQHGTLYLQGGQEPASGFSPLGASKLLRFVTGRLFYDFTPRLTGSAS